MKPFQTLPADHDNFFMCSLHLEVVLGETQSIFSVLQNFLNSANITLFTVRKLTIDYIYSQDFQISFRLFNAKFASRIDVRGKFPKDN